MEAGTIVTDYLDLGGLPLLRIWQVPKLELLAPLGMPSTESGSSIAADIKNWYQRR